MNQVTNFVTHHKASHDSSHQIWWLVHSLPAFKCLHKLPWKLAFHSRLKMSLLCRIPALQLTSSWWKIKCRLSPCLRTAGCISEELLKCYLSYVINNTIECAFVFWSTTFLGSFHVLSGYDGRTCPQLLSTVKIKPWCSYLLLLCQFAR